MRERLELIRGLDGQVWFYDDTATLRRMHHHDEPELNLIVRGRASYLLKDRRYELARHTLVWLFPAQEHVLIDQSPDFCMWIVVFRRRLIQRVCHAPAMRVLRQRNPAGEMCRLLDAEPAAGLCSLFGELARSRDQRDLFNQGLSYALLRAWHAHSQARRAQWSGVHPAVERAAQILRDEAEPTGLPDLAARAGLSPHRLSRLFKRQAGVSLVEFRQRQAIERFLRLYDPATETILSAALRAGFGSYPQFYRVFRQFTGQTPAQFRRRF